MDIGLLDATGQGVIQLAQAAGTELAPAAPAAPAVDFSVVGMFARASFVVQAVMVVLILASVWSWGIIIEKVVAFRRAGALIRRFEDEFWSGQPLEALYDRVGARGRAPAERVFAAGMTEWRKSIRQSGGILPGAQSRIERAMSVAIAREADGLNRRLAFLATVGSVSPFVGLFGTVWGIKESFESIAMQQSTNLAVVAPGIAEALLATALGLLAAIPAVVAYNRLVADSERLTNGLENFADEFSTILGRQIERAAGAAAASGGTG
jgi:biopolymer transport protein TolQ